MYNLDGRIGGDALLSPRGEQYARKLPELVRESVGVSFIPPSLFLIGILAHCTNTYMIRTTDPSQYGHLH